MAAKERFRLHGMHLWRLQRLRGPDHHQPCLDRPTSIRTNKAGVSAVRSHGWEVEETAVRVPVTTIELCFCEPGRKSEPISPANGLRLSWRNLAAGSLAPLLHPSSRGRPNRVADPNRRRPPSFPQRACGSVFVVRQNIIIIIIIAVTWETSRLEGPVAKSPSSQVRHIVSPFSYLPFMF
jgi:hypothetical protein